MPGLDWLTARPIAHRGLHDYSRAIVENTVSAFTAAVAGDYAIECDLQITADGEAMVHHDQVLGRLTEGSAPLDSMTAADLRQVPFTATSDRMISLGELCDLVSGRVTLVIELKSKYDGDLRLARRAAAVLSSYQGAAALMSFDTAQIAALRRIAPKLPRGIDAGNGSPHRNFASMLPHARRALAYCWHAVAAHPQFLAYSVRSLTTAIPLAARTLLGLPLLTWTVRSAEDRARAARWADQIIFEGFHP